jgi:hypothetical protein
MIWAVSGPRLPRAIALVQRCVRRCGRGSAPIPDEPAGPRRCAGDRGRSDGPHVRRPARAPLGACPHSRPKPRSLGRDQGPGCAGAHRRDLFEARHRRARAGGRDARQRRQYMGRRHGPHAYRSGTSGATSARIRLSSSSGRTTTSACSGKRCAMRASRCTRTRSRGARPILWRGVGHTKTAGRLAAGDRSGLGGGL